MHISYILKYQWLQVFWYLFLRFGILHAVRAIFTFNPYLFSKQCIHLFFAMHSRKFHISFAPTMQCSQDEIWILLSGQQQLLLNNTPPSLRHRFKSFVTLQLTHSMTCHNLPDRAIHIQPIPTHTHTTSSKVDYYKSPPTHYSRVEKQWSL